MHKVPLHGYTSFFFPESMNHVNIPFIFSSVVCTKLSISILKNTQSVCEKSESIGHDRNKDDWWCLKHSISTFHLWIVYCVASSNLLLFGCVMRPIVAGYLITHSHSGRSCDFHCTPGELAVGDGWSRHIGAITCNLEILHFTMLISIGLLDGKDDTCILFSSLASKY